MKLKYGFSSCVMRWHGSDNPQPSSSTTCKALPLSARSFILGEPGKALRCSVLLLMESRTLVSPRQRRHFNQRSGPLQRRHNLVLVLRDGWRHALHKYVTFSFEYAISMAWEIKLEAVVEAASPAGTRDAGREVAALTVEKHQRGPCGPAAADG